MNEKLSKGGAKKTCDRCSGNGWVGRNRFRGLPQRKPRTHGLKLSCPLGTQKPKVHLLGPLPKNRPN